MDGITKVAKFHAYNHILTRVALWGCTYPIEGHCALTPPSTPPREHSPPPSEPEINIEAVLAMYASPEWRNRDTYEVDERPDMTQEDWDRMEELLDDLVESCGYPRDQLPRWGPMGSWADSLEEDGCITA